MQVRVNVKSNEINTGRDLLSNPLSTHNGRILMQNLMKC